MPVRTAIYGKDDLNNLLGQNSEIESRYYKLWLASTTVLERILKSAIQNRTQTELEDIHKRMKFYVQNLSYSHAKKILDDHHYCIISGVPGIGKTTLANTLFVDFVQQGFEPVRIYNSVNEAFEMLKPEVRQVFYFDDFLGTTAFNEFSLERNEDKVLLTLLKAISNGSGVKKLILTTRDYILNQAELKCEPLSSSDLKAYFCTVSLRSYTRFNRAEILYNHIYFSDLDENSIAEILRDRTYLNIIDHPNYNPRIIEWMTQFKKRWSSQASFAEAFFEALDEPTEVWRYAFERHLSLPSRHLLLVLLTLPDFVKLDDLELVFQDFHTVKSKIFGFVMGDTDFRDALDEVEGTFININSWYDNSLVIKVANPSVRDFLDVYLSENLLNVPFLVETAKLFSQLVWLWGRHQIGGLLSKKPYQIKPKYRNLILQEEDSFSSSLLLTFYSSNPFLNREGRLPLRIAGRIIFLLDVNKIIKSNEIDKLIEEAISVLEERAQKGEEAAFQLLRLMDRLRDRVYLLRVKEAFISSIQGYAEFERYLIFKCRHSHLITKEDEQKIEQRFKSLYPNKDFSDYERQVAIGEIGEPPAHFFDKQKMEKLKKTEKLRPKPTNPNELIVDLFESLA